MNPPCSSTLHPLLPRACHLMSYKGSFRLRTFSQTASPNRAAPRGQLPLGCAIWPLAAPAAFGGSHDRAYTHSVALREPYRAFKVFSQHVLMGHLLLRVPHATRVSGLVRFERHKGSFASNGTEPSPPDSPAPSAYPQSEILHISNALRNTFMGMTCARTLSDTRKCSTPHSGYALTALKCAKPISEQQHPTVPSSACHHAVLLGLALLQRKLSTSTVRVCVAFLLELAELAQPVEMPRLRWNAHAQAKPQPTGRALRIHRLHLFYLPRQSTQAPLVPPPPPPRLSPACHVQALLTAKRVDQNEHLGPRAGTIFHSILLWRVHVPEHTSSASNPAATSASATAQAPSPCKPAAQLVPPTMKLEGHVGSLMAVHWAAEHRLILSAADDRTARVWKLPEWPAAPPGEALAVRPTLDLWGHAARVWAVALLGSCASSACFCLPVLAAAVLNSPLLSIALVCFPLLSSAALFSPLISSALFTSPLLLGSVTLFLEHLSLHDGSLCGFCAVNHRAG